MRALNGIGLPMSQAFINGRFIGRPGGARQVLGGTFFQPTLLTSACIGGLD